MTGGLRTNRGALWMLVAGFMFTCMGICVKLGARYFSPAELVFYRSFVGLLAIWIIVRVRGNSLATPYWRQHLNRSLSGFGALSMYFYTIAALPLATAVTLNYTSSLFIALISTLMLRERPPWQLLLAVLLGFVGVVALLNPTLHSDQLLDGMIGLVSGVLAAIAMINVRSLGRIGEPEWRVVFYFSLVSTVGAGVWMSLHRFSPITLPGLALIIGMGSAATLAQLALTRAYSRGRTLVVASLAYSTVAFASIAGLLLWGDWLSPSSWLGVVAIVLSGLISTQALPVAKPRRTGG
mgnify:FL=1